MGKHNILSIEEVENFNINPLVLSMIEQVKEEFDIDDSEIRILDWGCGRGRAVGKLRLLGYEAYGVDIDPNVVDKGSLTFADLGLGKDCLGVIGIDNQSEFEQDMFHIVMSEHVFEHVKHFEQLASEFSRIQKKGGRSYHVFPAKYTPVEVHLRMPFVHWIPKGIFRRLLITFWTILGIDPKWNVSDKGKIRTYGDYSINNTYYRNLWRIRKILKRKGFDMSYLTLKNHKVNRALNKILIYRMKFLRPLFQVLITNFALVHIETKKVR